MNHDPTDPQPFPSAPAEGSAVPDLLGTEDIYRRVLATANAELNKGPALLFWSGIAAGLTIGLSFLARVILTAQAGASEPGLLANLLFPIGFVLVVLGRYALFTENTLTPVALVIPRFASLRDLLRIWGVVLVANLLGAAAIAGLLAGTGIFDESVNTIAFRVARNVLEASWGAAFSRALLAGWLVASIVWLVHSARETTARILFIWLIIYLVGIADLFHIITHAVEVFYLAFTQGVESLVLIPNFLIPTLLGNTVGGVVFVALLNYAQIGRKALQDYGPRLSWDDWFFTTRRSHKQG